MKVVQVYLDQPGGGPAHVRLLKSILSSEVMIDSFPINQKRLRSSPAEWRLVARDLERHLDTTTIIHAHGIRAAAAAVGPARRNRIPVVVTIHGLHSLRRSRVLAPWVRAMNRFVLRSCDRVLVLGESDFTLLADGGFVPSQRLRRITAACLPRSPMSKLECRKMLGIPADGKVVVWLGRLAPEKAPADFLAIMERVHDRECIGLVVGNGPLYEDLCEASLSTNVRMMGWMNDPGPALAAADVFVSTSLWEGLPIAALEAAGAGLPLVLSDCPGNRDLASNGVPVLLVPPHDTEGASLLIERLLADPIARDSLGMKSQEAAEAAFSVEKLRADVLTTYREFRIA